MQKYFSNKSIVKIFALACLLFFVFSSIKYQFGVWKSVSSVNLASEKYAPLIYWFEQNGEKNSVILANDNVSNYIPLLTDKYILFNHYVSFHIMSDYEVEERYLVSMVFTKLTKEKLINDFREYSGVGNSIHEINLLNRKNKLCIKSEFLLGDLNCGRFFDIYSFKGDSYFNNLMDRYYVIKKDPKKFLDMYNVSFILKDTKDKDWIIPKNFKLLFADDKFEVYKALF